MIELTDNDILSRLTNTEDSTVERKTASDFRDCLKTAVAFSNSLPVDDPGIIFVGVGNDGTVQDNSNLDSLQRKVSEEIGRVFPTIHPQMKIMKDGNGKQFLAVIVRGSNNRPHFAGPSYVRDGSQTVVASEAQFERLIAERSSKARFIRQWLGSQVTVVIPTKCMVITNQVQRMVETTQRFPGVVSDCNQFYVTADLEGTSGPHSWPLDALFIGFDNENGRPELIVSDEIALKSVRY